VSALVLFPPGARLPTVDVLGGVPLHVWAWQAAGGLVIHAREQLGGRAGHSLGGAAASGCAGAWGTSQPANGCSRRRGGAGRGGAGDIEMCTIEQ
jgi:hypothetical protein